MTDPIEIRTHVAPAADDALEAFMDVGSWWPLAERNVLGPSSTLAFDGDRLVESNGAERAVWGSNVEVDAPRRIRLEFHPFVDPSDASQLEIRFEPTETGTQIVLLHLGWERLGDAGSVASGWREVLGRFASAVRLDALATARAYHSAWSRGDFASAIELLSPQVEVEVPVNEYPDRDSFAEALRGFGSICRDVELLSATGNREEATLVYDMEVEGLGAMRVAEHFTVRGGRVETLRQIHDTAALRAAGFVTG